VLDQEGQRIVDQFGVEDVVVVRTITTSFGIVAMSLSRAVSVASVGGGACGDWSTVNNPSPIPGATVWRAATR
jgi:hypothetical protein